MKWHGNDSYNNNLWYWVYNVSFHCIFNAKIEQLQQYYCFEDVHVQRKIFKPLVLSIYLHKHIHFEYCLKSLSPSHIQSVKKNSIHSKSCTSFSEYYLNHFFQFISSFDKLRHSV